MDLKILVLPLLLMMTGSAFAADTADIDLEKGQEQQDEEDEENACGFLGQGWRLVKRSGHYVFDKLGDPTVQTILGVTYAGEQTIGNFLWGFNWAEHADASDEAHMIVQETGAMLVVAGCFFAGVLIPLAVLSYRKKHPSPAGNTGN